MGVVVSVSDKLDSKAQSWRILFRKTLLENETAFATVTEPETLIATAQSIDVADALAGASIAGSVGLKLAASAEDDGVLRRHFGKYIGSPEGREEKSLVLVWVPSDAVDSKNIEALVNSRWEVEGRYSKRPLIRAGISTSRVFWSDDCAIIFAPAGQSKDAIDAVIRFTIAARQTFSLEEQMADLWVHIDAHKSLIHAVKPRDLRFQATVNTLTERAMEMRCVYLRLIRTIEQLDPSLDNVSKRLYAELAHQAKLEDRLELFEEQNEAAMDHYELANSRLYEAKAVRTEMILQVLILLMLLGELIMSVLIYAATRNADDLKDRTPSTTIGALVLPNEQNRGAVSPRPEEARTPAVDLGGSMPSAAEDGKREAGGAKGGQMPTIDLGGPVPPAAEEGKREAGGARGGQMPTIDLGGSVPPAAEDGKHEAVGPEGAQMPIFDLGGPVPPAAEDGKREAAAIEVPDEASSQPSSNILRGPTPMPRRRPAAEKDAAIAPPRRTVVRPQPRPPAAANQTLVSTPSTPLFWPLIRQ